MAQGKILVIDDEEIICDFFEEVLSEAGYEVDTTSTGAEALEKIKSEKYGVIFVDHGLPDTDSGQLCKEMKKISPQSVPVFMTGRLRGKELVNNELTFSQAGGRLYQLYKPFSKEEILEATKKALLSGT